jgi:hypothetical protein
MFIDSNYKVVMWMWSVVRVVWRLDMHIEDDVLCRADGVEELAPYLV